MSLHTYLPPIWKSRSKDDSEVIGENTVNFRRYGVKRVSNRMLSKKIYLHKILEGKIC